MDDPIGNCTVISFSKLLWKNIRLILTLATGDFFNLAKQKLSKLLFSGTIFNPFFGNSILVHSSGKLVSTKEIPRNIFRKWRSGRI